MPDSDQAKQMSEDSAVRDEKPACVALVAVETCRSYAPVAVRHLSRADFIAQLIATAEHVPQTRTLRRATPADARSAYVARHDTPVQRSGVRTRQIV
jgi:hypothetical protein